MDNTSMELGSRVAACGHTEHRWLDESEGLIWWECKCCGAISFDYQDCVSGR